MSLTIQALGIDQMSREQRIALVQEIWNTIVAESGQPLLTETQRQELQRRVKEDETNPNDVVPWEQVKAQTQGAVEIMTLPIVFRPAAQAEFDDAAVWYENNQPGLGDDFVAEIQQVLDVIANQPERYPIADGDVREAPISRFPYCIYYRVKSDRIVVVTVFHMSRDPSILHGRK